MAERTITDADRKAAANLKRIWLKHKEHHAEATQAYIAEKLGWTQGAFGQYANGQVPLGVRATLLLAQFFDVDPKEIRNDFSDLILSDTLTTVSKTARSEGSSAKGKGSSLPPDNGELLEKCYEKVEAELAKLYAMTHPIWQRKYRTKLARGAYSIAQQKNGRIDEKLLREAIRHLAKMA